MMQKTNRLKILIVDDNPTARKGLGALLISFRQINAYKIEIVGEAANGQEAVALAQKLVPDLIFMDINMPLMDGLEATRLIKKILKETPIVVLSMHSDQREAALQSGANDYIVKGTETHRIKQVLQHCTADS